MIGNSRTRQYLAEQLRATGARTVKKRSGQAPTHSTLDKEWIVEPHALAELERAHLLDLQVGMPSAYMAEYHGPNFPLHLSLTLSHLDAAALLQLQTELGGHAAVCSPMIVLRACDKSGRVRLHFPTWMVDEVQALQMHAYAMHWLALQAPELGVKIESDGDAYRNPVPLLGCPQMLCCSSCRGASGRMELCSQCGMTGWIEQRGSRMELLGSWDAEQQPLALPQHELLCQLRLHSDKSPNMRVPPCAPPLPLWVCKCQTWRSQKDSRCSACGTRAGVGRMKWGTMYTQPSTAVPLTLHSEDGWRLPVLQTAFRNLLRIVGGSLDHPWQRCFMGPVWKLGPAKFVLPLQGLGSSCHPGGSHPHAPMMLTITPQWGELSCSAPGCKFSTGKRPLYLPQLFPVAETQSLGSAYQLAHSDTRLHWVGKFLDDYHASQRI